MVAFHPFKHHPPGLWVPCFRGRLRFEHDPFGDGWLTNPFQTSARKKLDHFPHKIGVNIKTEYIFETYSHTTPIRIPKDMGSSYGKLTVNKGVPCPWGSLKIPLIFIPLTKVKKEKRLSRIHPSSSSRKPYPLRWIQDERLPESVVSNS